MVHYKPVKINFNALGLAKIIIDMVIRQYRLPDSIVTNKSSFSPQNSDHCFGIFLSLNRGFLPLFTLRLAVRLSDKTALWKRISEPLWTSSTMTGPSSYQWSSLLTIMRKTRALAIRLLSWTKAIILAFPLKKILILASDQNQQMSSQRNYEIWWLFARRTSTTLKSFKNELTTKASSLRGTLLVTKFGWIANTSKPNANRNLSLSSLNRYKFYIR